MKVRNVEVLIVGAGPAGLAAAAACYDAGCRDILLLERDDSAGGILQQCIHNGFGLHYFKTEMTGPEYAQRFIDMVGEKGSGVELKTGTMVLEITKDKRVYAVSREDGVIACDCKAIVLAMGCRERTRGALNIAGTRPAGIYTAGCAQRLVNMEGFLPGKSVVVLGSGDIGLIMARRMKWEGAEVKLVAELMPYSSGLTRNIVQCLEDNDIPLRFEHTVVKIHGNERLEGVTVAKVDAERKPITETEEFISCDTLLLSVGLIPENELTLGMGIAIDPVTGGAYVDENRQTELSGVFCCGNVLHVHDLVDNVSEEAGIAGAAAARYAAGGSESGAAQNVVAGEGVRYVVPHMLSADAVDKDIAFYFRTGRVIRNARIDVSAGGEVILSKKKSILTPGEMEKLIIPAKGRMGDITLSAREAKGK